MKYKNPTTGNWEEVYVKTADSLPIGSVIDYNGATVPSGWEQVTSDIAVVTGTMTINAESMGLDTPAYPTGFTAENCVPIAFGVVNSLSAYMAKGYNYYGSYHDSMDLLLSGFRRMLNMKADNIDVRVWNPFTQDSLSINYKIVLMKIS